MPTRFSCFRFLFSLFLPEITRSKGFIIPTTSFCTKHLGPASTLPLHDPRSHRRRRRPTLEALLASPQHPLVDPSLIPARTKRTHVPIAAAHHHGCQRSRRRRWSPFDASPARTKQHEPTIFSSDTRPNRLR